MSTTEKKETRLEFHIGCLGEYGGSVAKYLAEDGAFDDAKISKDPAEFARLLQNWLQFQAGQKIESLGRDFGIIREALNHPEIWENNELTSQLIGELGQLEKELIHLGKSIHRRVGKHTE